MDVAERARNALVSEGIPTSAVDVGRARDEQPSLRAEMRDELDNAWILPQASFVAPKEGARSFVVVTVAICAVAAIVAVPVAFIDFGAAFWVRLLIVEGVFLAAGLGLGLVLGPALGVKRPGEPMAAQRGVTLRVHSDDERIQNLLLAFDPIRLDEITPGGSPLATVATEEDRRGRDGVGGEVSKATSDVATNLGTDDYHPPSDNRDDRRSSRSN
jgi:hypothetical protein